MKKVDGDFVISGPYRHYWTPWGHVIGYHDVVYVQHQPSGAICVVESHQKARGVGKRHIAKTTTHGYYDHPAPRFLSQRQAIEAAKANCLKEAHDN